MSTTELINIIGGSMMALSFVTIGIICLVYAKYGERPYRRKIAYLFGVFIFFSGISRGIGVFSDYHQLDLINGIVKMICGIAGFISIGIMPRAIKELSRVQSIEETHREMDETKKAIDSLTEISEKMDIRQPR